MNCPQCEHANIENARFCAKCGALLPTPAAAEEVDPLVGQTIGGRYRIVRMLGEGGMGRVYEAEKMIAGHARKMAIKTLHPHLSNDPQILERFNRECGTLVGLRHPNTIQVEDFGQHTDGTLYIVMEFVNGVSVAQELEKRGAMAPDRVERIMEQTCGSLAEAHKNGIIHRDLKPDNIVLMNVGEDTDVVKVLDFGIAARKESADAKKEQKLTQQGMVLGTPPYMSPEQFMGKELDARSDIYSLGVMAYEMLTSKLPFDANTPWEWATKHMTAQPFPFEDMPTTSDIPGKMKHAIMRALAKNPSERQENVKQFFEELRSGKIDNAIRMSNPGEPGGVQPTAAMPSFVDSSRGGTQMGGAYPSSPGFAGPGSSGGYAPPQGYGTGPQPSYGAPPQPGYSTGPQPGYSTGPQPGYTGAPQPGYPSSPGFAPAVVPAVPPPSAPAEGGGNKGIVIALVSVAGLMVLGIGGYALSRMGGKDKDPGTLNLNPSTTSTVTAPGPATVTALPSSTVAAADTGTTKPATPTNPTNPGGATNPGTPSTATTTAPTATSTAKAGPEACTDAQRQASSNLHGAMASFAKCSGPDQGNAKRAIAGAVPGAVRSQVLRGDCSGARQTAAAGRSYGAAPVDVDRQYPQCKGK